MPPKPKKTTGKPCSSCGRYFHNTKTIKKVLYCNDCASIVQNTYGGDPNKAAPHYPLVNPWTGKPNP